MATILANCSNIKVGDKVVRNPETWMYGSQDRDYEGNQLTGIITNIEEQLSDYVWVEVEWMSNEKVYHSNNYDVHNDPEKTSLLIVKDLQGYVSDVSEADAKLKQVTKFLVKHVEESEYPFICVNTKEELDNFKEGNKTSEWSYFVEI